MCMCNHLCPCDLLTVLAWGTITRAKADTLCYSSPVFHSLHSGSECPALFSLFHLFTSSPPPNPAHLSPSLSHSLNDPRCAFSAPHGNQTGDAEPGCAVCGLSMFVNAVHVCVCARGFSSLTTD